MHDLWRAAAATTLAAVAAAAAAHPFEHVVLSGRAQHLLLLDSASCAPGRFRATGDPAASRVQRRRAAAPSSAPAL